MSADRAAAVTNSPPTRRSADRCSTGSEKLVYACKITHEDKKWTNEMKNGSKFSVVNDVICVQRQVRRKDFLINVERTAIGSGRVCCLSPPS